MQPYRLAIASSSAPSCLDPPIRACEPQPRRTWRLEALAAAALTLAGVSGVWIGRQIGHRGHVEIAPPALALARRAQPAKRRERPTRQARPARAAPPKTADRAFVVGAHDPKALVAQAKKLAAIGVDLTISEVTVSRAFPRGDKTELLDDLAPITWLPLHDDTHGVLALEATRVPATSPLSAAGLVDGDCVVSIDGWDFTRDPTIDPVAKDDVLRAWSVIELVRGGHHVVLSIHWK